jgi:hypothetical protein
MEAEFKNKSDNKIQLENVEDILRLEITDVNGESTGEFLEFDLTNPNYLLNYQELIEEDKKNRRIFRDRILIIEKQQDHKGKKLFSYKEEETLKAYSDFNKNSEKIYDMFLGKGGLRKLLNGREISLTTLGAVDRVIENQIVPLLEKNAKDIKSKIMSKYSTEKRSDVIE